MSGDHHHPLGGDLVAERAELQWFRVAALHRHVAGLIERRDMMALLNEYSDQADQEEEQDDR